MDEQAVLEQKYAPARQAIFTILQSTNTYNLQVVRILIDVFKDIPNVTNHGPILWALMIKSEVSDRYLRVL